MSVYRKLQQHLDKYPVGFPETETAVEIEILKSFFSPLEAGIVLCLSITPNSIFRILVRYRLMWEKRITFTELRKSLEKLYMEGSIIKSSNGKYSLAFLAIGMFEFHVDDLTPKLMKLMHSYFEEGFGNEFFRGGIPQLRTSPHLKALSPEYKVDTYDNIRQFVSNWDDKIGVANCVCKQGEKELGKSCKQVTDFEICLFFGESPYIERDRGRYISKTECLGILERSERDGLVIQPGNTLKPFCICLCCGCCCGVLTSAKKRKDPSSLFATNYAADFNKDLCINCGICISRCQMDAFSKSDGTIIFSSNKCIGCGLCVTTCPVGAVKLKKKKKPVRPPLSIELLYLKILAQKSSKYEFTKSLIKLALGMRL
ncbi:MAG: 4Fe-4S binding protein [Deltaproteobacteria bacterium]|nr:4Fe-4S binding protein [Deltaproteobacteria bacterium]